MTPLLVILSLIRYGTIRDSLKRYCPLLFSPLYDFLKNGKSDIWKDQRNLHKPLTRLRKKKIQSAKIRNERGDITIDPTRIGL